MIVLKNRINSKALREFFQRVRHYYVLRPMELMRALREWWWQEGREVFQTQGARTGSPWRPISPEWAARKDSSEINVLIGSTKSALTGGHGAWYRVHGGQQQIGVSIDPRKFVTLSKWRPLTSLRQQQLAALDRAEQRAINTQIDPRLPV